tara:strand:- start:108 stop:902 length:795 start_codon:yes stop_codon:yes gene_type:complete
MTIQREFIKIMEIEDFISEEEINYILSSCIKFKRSKIVNGEMNEDISHITTSEFSSVDLDVRSSESAKMNRDFHYGETSINIKKRVSKIINVNWLNVENLGVIKYNEGEEYKTHMDCWIPNTSAYKEQIKNGGQRIYTCLIYLNDDFSGGETEFINANIKIIPKKGKAVFWNHLRNIGNCDGVVSDDYNLPNILSCHSGNPVKKGIKYACNIFVREKNFPMSKNPPTNTNYIEEDTADLIEYKPKIVTTHNILHTHSVYHIMNP